MNESRVFEAQQPNAATHALIIGVGTYPHLLGGAGPVMANPQGLGQLTSPPVSARALANWLIASFKNPERPLGSVRLLASAYPAQAQDGEVFDPNLAGVAPTIAAIEQAVREWLADGGTNPENQLLFYFCGHGIGANSLLALLAQDFGADPNDDLDAAIDFYRFRNGMNRCAAKYQCYFVDACRSDADLLAYGLGVAGKWFVTQPAGTQKKQQPTFWSTQQGELAHGPIGKTSYYTQALLKGLAGTGAMRSANTWNVVTSRLHEAVTAHMKRLKKAQVPPADELTIFQITSTEDPPIVPVFVKCKPSDAYPQITLTCRTSQAELYRAKMSDEEIELELAEGSYEFEAVPDDAGAYASSVCTHTIQPPEYPIEIKVQ